MPPLQILSAHAILYSIPSSTCDVTVTYESLDFPRHPCFLVWEDLKMFFNSDILSTEWDVSQNSMCIFFQVLIFKNTPLRPSADQSSDGLCLSTTIYGIAILC